MKSKRRRYAVAAIVVVIIALAILVTLNYVYSSRPGKDNLSTNSFFQEPVVDLIMPTLFANGLNAPLNMTRGSSASLPLEIFPTINLKVVIGANIISLSSPNENLSNTISTSINPSTLEIAQETSGNATLKITASAATQLGEYSVTVTATNSENESQYWGTVFQLNVLP